jgi:hypothetical protein
MDGGVRRAGEGEGGHGCAGADALAEHRGGVGVAGRIVVLVRWPVRVEGRVVAPGDGR